MNLVRGRRVDPGTEAVRELAGEDAALHEIAEFMESSASNDKDVMPSTFPGGE